MFYNRVDIFNITFFQLIRKFIKIIFFKINSKVIATKRNIAFPNKVFICFNCLQSQTAS
ncbi:Uncharacterised protein [Bifidobacterium longum subsp. infantis]|nr:hypothetical protein BLIC_a00338 [Bifidobacterium longum subsp. infantis]CEF04378.1 hypothetical protein BLIC_d00345 [Bifidobacterium longum subsp. infantis]CEF07993.1 hypothetical protein BLIC_h00343 [Bifidobacterium longum subsp. infantis]SPU39636.1 Uncharacterised protein [Bifidobacterium longum subsp. infantis]VEG40084.1 Uncharacterised protein [Bifidobacterium longum subsp. infantis]